MEHKTPADRAKLFVPFDALKGFREALREKERIILPKVELTEDRKFELDYKLKQLAICDIVTVVYFHKDEYIQITGMVAKITPSSHLLQIVDTKIRFEDIVDIQGDFKEEFFEPSL